MRDGKITLTVSQLADLANYCYDRQQSTELENRHCNEFLLWIVDWIRETKAQKAERQNAYLSAPEKRTAEYHKQLVKMARDLGMLS